MLFSIEESCHGAQHVAIISLLLSLRLWSARICLRLSLVAFYLAVQRSSELTAPFLIIVLHIVLSDESLCHEFAAMLIFFQIQCSCTLLIAVASKWTRLEVVVIISSLVSHQLHSWMYGSGEAYLVLTSHWEARNFCSKQRRSRESCYLSCSRANITSFLHFNVVLSLLIPESSVSEAHK